MNRPGYTHWGRSEPGKVGVTSLPSELKGKSPTWCVSLIELILRNFCVFIFVLSRRA